MFELNEKIKTWIPIEEIEPQCIQQVEKLGRMPFIYKHLAVMPDVHLGRGASVGTCIPTEGAIIPAAVGVDIGCLQGDTKIPLLNGTQKTLKELTELDEEFWVYSINPQNLKVVPGKAKSLKTQDNAKLIKVTVSGGEEIICTLDHEFMLVDGTYKRADTLEFRDSLMPFYRKWFRNDGYESVSNGAGFQNTHQLVWEAVNGYRVPNTVVHHVNFLEYDNRPENLQNMTHKEHGKVHRETNNWIIEKNKDPEFQAIRLEGIRESNKNPIRQAQMKEMGALENLYDRTTRRI